MPKAKGKSSASSATRKKQANKAAKKAAYERDEDGNLLRPDLVEALEKAKQRGPQRGQKKDKSKKDGKGKKGKGGKKQYIPPPKPPQPLPDPLDSMGLASLLPADLVVLLRKASKKDVITRCRALEGLLAWVQDALGKATKPTGYENASAEPSNLTAEEKREALVMMLPSWVHLFPRLALSPTRRLRLLTMQIQTLLLEKPQQPSEEASSTRAELLESPQYIEPILGPWAILCHDTDRTIERLGRTAWSDTCTWKSVDSAQDATDSGNSVQLDLNEHSDTLIAHLRTVLLSPSPSYAFSMTPALAVGASDSSMSRTSSGHATPSLQTGNVERDAKNRDENVEEDTAALDKRLVAGALAVLTSIIQQRPSSEVMQSLQDILSSRLVWASLSPHDLAASSGKRHDAASSVTSFGYDSPAVRLRAWTLLRTLYSVIPDVVNENLSTIGTVAMASIWQERDNAVQRATIDAILPLLKNRPDLWLIGAEQSTRGDSSKRRTGDDDSSDDDDDDEEDSDEDDDDEDSSSDAGSEDDKHQVDSKASPTPSRPKPRAYTSFLQWLQSACGGAPNVGYSAVVVFISTIPVEILPHNDFESTSDLLTQFFSALYSRPLDFDPTGCRAFLASFAECVTFLALRMLKAGSTAGSDIADSARELVRVHLGAAWEELVLDKDSTLSSLSTGSAAKDNDDAARASRIKSIGSSRIVSDLAIQVRRMASANPDLKILQAFLTDIEQGIVAVTRALPQAPMDLSLPSRTQVLASLERATSFYAALAPSQGQQASTELRNLSATTLSQIIRLTVSGLADVTADTKSAPDARRFRATLLVDFLSLLVRAVVSLPDALDTATSHELAQATSVSLPQLLGTKGVAPAATASFLIAYLPICKDAATRASIWTETLSSVAHLEELSDRTNAMSELIKASKVVLKSKDGEKEAEMLLPVPKPEAGIEELLMELVFALCDSGTLPNEQRHRLENVVADVLANPAPFVSQDGCHNMLKVITSTIEQLRSVLFERLRPDEDVQSRQAKAAVVVVALIGCINVWLEAQPDEQSRRLLSTDSSYTGFVTALSDLRSLRHDSPHLQPDEVAVYCDLWTGGDKLHNRIMRDALPERRAELDSEALDSLQDHLLDLQIPVSRLVTTAGLKTALLPDQKELAEMLLKACKQESNPALLVFDPLISQSPASRTSGSAFDPLVDNQGLGIFARVCLAALFIMDQNREQAKSNLRLLPLVVMLSMLIEDDLLLPGASKHALDSIISPADHREWLQSAVKMSTALVSALSESVTENWHNDMVASLQRGTTIDADKDGYGHVLSTLWQLATQAEGSGSYLARIFHRLLNAAFSFGTVTEAGAERWLKLGDAVQDRMPAMAYAIYNAAKPIAGSSPGYDRLRNGAAAKLSGIRPGSPQIKFLGALRALVALAPVEDSELSLIPQQRAIFLLKDLEKWSASEETDEEPDDEVNTRLAELLIHLLPVVQDVQGSHIEFMFDIIETNLEFCSLEEDASLAQLFHTLRLLDLMRELASRNANLREYWTSHGKPTIANLRNLFLSLAGMHSVSAPQQACVDLIVDLIRETSETPFSLQESAQALCTLVVQSPSHEVQVIAFRLLSAAIRENVKGLVVEAAIDADSLARKEDGQNRLRIPEPLVANVSDNLSPQLNLLVEEGAARRTAFGYFLSWIAIFEHFEGASMWVKAAFLEDLHKRGVLIDSLLPSVFALVGLADENRRPFDPSRFVLEEVFLDQIDAETSLTVLQVLAAHVYLRALIHVPTKVRSWWGEIKDRQHSIQISSFTTRHCSPIIATRELSHLRDPSALAKLQDDALSIKILSTNEVIATYLVDEHSMEIGIKIPPDFPLHSVEIRDIQRVGITEAKWRAWLLDVGQLITGQNGLIFDALSLFKRYAEVQFQGLDECAICYSIISPMDRSLPTKPCRTCKNKFHAGCLFKWISTSGASTCPLCRSIL